MDASVGAQATTGRRECACAWDSGPVVAAGACDELNGAAKALAYSCWWGVGFGAPDSRSTGAAFEGLDLVGVMPGRVRERVPVGVSDPDVA